MTKQEFTKAYLEPLADGLSLEILWNGKAARELGRGARGGTLGVAYTGAERKTVTLLWQRDRQNTLQTLFHEVGHVLLHAKGCKKGKFYRECEAESVAKRVCEALGEPYRAHFRGSPDVNYLEYYWKRYLLLCLRRRRKPKALREKRIDQAVAAILSALSDGKQEVI